MSSLLYFKKTNKNFHNKKNTENIQSFFINKIIRDSNGIN